MISVIIPMAGEGKRFKDAGYELPKMLIKAKGKSLLEWSLESLPLNICNKLIFIGLEKHNHDFGLESYIENLMFNQFPSFDCVWINQTTRGQSETALKAKHLIHSDDSLIIFNIDTFFQSKTLVSNLIGNNNGVLGAFKSKSPNFSYAMIDNQGFVTKVKEKEVISENALSGFYNFKRAKDFFDIAQESINNNETFKGEFYIAPLYNKLIDDGHKYVLDFCSVIEILGTPSELQSFIQGN